MAPTHYTVSGDGPKLIITFSTLIAIATISILLRVYVRAFMIKSFGSDDWIAILGWLAYMALASTAIASTYHGFGQHAQLIQPHSEIQTGLMLTWTSECLYATASMLIKLSICFMLLRFVMERAHRILLYIVISSTSLSSIVFFFVFVFQCTPVSYFWHRSQADSQGKCIDPIIVVVGTYLYSASCIFCDWSMAILPWFLVRDLHMDRRTKTLVVFVLAMGSVASIASIGRLAYVKRLGNTSDLLYEITGVAIWSACETGLGLVASCVATLRPLLTVMRADRRRFSAGGDPVRLSNLRNPSPRVKRPQLPWSELLDSYTEYTLESSEQSHFSDERTLTEKQIVETASSTYGSASRQACVVGRVLETAED